MAMILGSLQFETLHSLETYSAFLKFLKLVIVTQIIHVIQITDDCLVYPIYGATSWVFSESEGAGGQGDEGAGGGGHEADQTWWAARSWPCCGPLKR